jgi:hypothetical protein
MDYVNGRAALLGYCFSELLLIGCWDAVSRQPSSRAPLVLLLGAGIYIH